MKVVYISQTCPPEPGATKRPLEQAKVLVSLGHEVILITAFPSYPFGQTHDFYRLRLWSVEKIGNVKVIRVWTLVAANTGIVRRMLSFITFAIAATIAGLLQGPIDVVIGSVPKPLTELAALITARVRRAIFVVELRDLMPDTLTNVGFCSKSIGYRMFDGYYRWIYRRVDVFALVYKQMIEKLRIRGAIKAKMLLLSHAVDPMIIQESRDELRAKLNLTNRFVVTYAGSFSAYYRIPLVIEAAQIAAQLYPEVEFLLIGAGPDFAMVSESIRSQQLHNVKLLGGIDPPLVAQYLEASDVFIHPQYLPELMHGTKILEYFSAGKPVVNICIHPDSAGQVEHFSVGRSVELGNATAMIQAIAFFKSNPERAAQAGYAAKELIKERFERHVVVEKFAAELAEIIDISN